MMDFKYRDDFKRILKNYQMSDRAKAALQGLRLALLVSPTSAGKNTVIQKLVTTGKYHFIVSDTTREPQLRDGKMEETGVNYFFRTEQEVLTDLRAGEFLEAAIIHENYIYGISIRELERAKLLNKVAITDVDIVGTDNVMRTKPDAKAIFLIPPNFDEWMRRLTTRSRVSDQELRNRLVSAEKEFDAALVSDYYHYVITENVDQSTALIDAIINNQPNTHQDRGRQTIHQLQEQLRHKLSGRF